ncbi:nickel/cobalt transporter [Pectobacteriaceae bacterium CE70]|nr:nickel/cobalt transporter [Pectobacteriaceae bacterium C52]WJV65819.1 nickel/cobalt transporter [Pectobacteriaceae bacterium CE70]WJY09838.1 nickel/cobalt transporter [Pectobacteriaceae bacterium C80]
MSMNMTGTIRPISRFRWLLNLWPLVLFLLLLTVGLREAFVYWPEVLMRSVVWQKSLHQQMSQLMELVKAQPHRAGLSLMVFSLVYGVLHAVGPGHGKVVIATYLATHPSKLKNSLQLTFAAAMLQGMVAIVLVTLVLTVLQLSSHALHISTFWMEKGSFILVIGLGCVLCLRAGKGLIGVLVSAYRNRPVFRIQRVTSIMTERTPKNILRQPVSPVHRHDAHCGCGHRHMPTPEELERDSGLRTRLLVILSMGLRPCSGAIMVLLFAKVIGVFGWGVASALTMALGTALTVSVLAVLVFYCRRWVEKLNRHNTPVIWQHIVWYTLSLAGGVVLVGSGVLLYLITQPALMGGIRPFAG